MQERTPPSTGTFLEVAYNPISSLRPDPRNARTHSKRQIAQIVDSIRAFGFTNPILIDGESIVIAGHGRVLAAKSLGLETVPTIALPHLNEAQRRALRIADNKIGLNAAWDVDLLKLELSELSGLDLGFDLTTTGFEIGEIDVMLNPRPDPDDEQIPAAPATPRTKPGDIWACGPHRIGCGDCRERAVRWVGQWLCASN
jgi:ParB-like chromosome segregation protein Spo0J